MQPLERGEKRGKSIRGSVTSTMVVSFIVMLLLVHVVLFVSLQKLFTERENESILNRAEVAESLLHASVAAVPTFARSWASRDETYQFVQGKNATFASTELTAHPLNLYQLNSITVLDSGGNVVHQNYYNYHTRKNMVAHKNLQALYSKINEETLRNYENMPAENQKSSDVGQFGVSGFVHEGGRSYFLSSFPVLHTDETGPAVGTVVFGRIIDEAMYKTIAKESNVDFSVQKTSQLNITKRQLQQLTYNGTLVLHNQEESVAYRTLTDMFGQKSLVVKVNLAHTLYWQGNQFFLFMLALIAVCCMAVLVLTLFVLHRKVSRPITSLVAALNEVNMENIDTAVATNTEINELNQLGESVNNLLARIENDRDVIKKHNETLFKAANFDSLTGLHNRESAGKMLQKQIQQAHSAQNHIAVFFCDLDRFKNINDTMGHTVGDELIVMVAQRLKDCFAETVLLARMGGDEFLLCVDNVGDDASHETVAAEIFSLFEVPFGIKERELVVKISVGTARYPEDGDDADSLLKNAEIAMYEAKNAGEGLLVHYQGCFQTVLQQKIRLENTLREAVNKGCEAFEMYLQPKVMVGTGEIKSCEALVRWVTPEGIIMPGAFIPQAEESGLIIPLTWWIMRECCRICGHLQKIGMPQMISINVSAQVLMHENFLDNLADAAKDFNTNLNYIDIEITESTLLEDVERGGLVLNILNKMGVEISVDDFGTGYSSLSYLNKLRVDRIKVDQSFVAGIGRDENDKVIVRTILAMAKNLGTIATAEGVETQEQYQFMKEEHCEEVQGYFVSRPLPEAQYIAFLRNNHGHYHFETGGGQIHGA